MDTTNLRIIKKLENGRYKIQVVFKYTDPLDRRRRVYKKTLENVTLKQAREHRDEAKQSATSSEAPKNARLKEYVADYQRDRMTRRNLRPATLLSEARILERVIVPEVGDWVVERITRRDCNDLLNYWISEKTKEDGSTYSGWTVSNWWKAFRQLLRYACNEIGLRSPAEDVNGIPKKKKAKTALTMPEARKMLIAAKKQKPQYYAFILLGIATGARFSEISSLRWSDIDESTGQIRFMRSQFLGYFSEDGNKTHRVFQFPLLPELQDALKEHRKYLMRSNHKGLSSGLVFSANMKPEESKLNGTLAPTTIRNAIKHCCKAAQVPVIGIHEMRHTLNTLALEHGIRAEVLRSVTGHQDEEMTMHYYQPHAEAQTAEFGPILTLLTGEK